VRLLRRGVRRYGTRTSAPRLSPAPFDDAWLDRVDRDGIAMRDALRDIGGDRCDRLMRPRRRLDRRLLELHIEQGPALESEGLPIGVVTGIQARYATLGDRGTPHAARRRWRPRDALARRGARARDRGDRRETPDWSRRRRADAEPVR